MNLNHCSPVKQLHVTVCAIRVNYAFHLIVEGLTVCTLSGGGVCMNYRFFGVFAVTML